MERYDFRRRFVLHTFFPVFVVPLAIAQVIFHFAPTTITTNTLSSILAVLLWNVAWVQVTDYRRSRDAARLGAQIIPCIKGKWPGNLDIVLKMIQLNKSAHIGDYLLGLLESVDSTTINLRFFWSDHFFTIDEAVVKHILATGFDNFDKGWRSKQTLEEFLGAGIFNRDGEVWKAHRAITRPFFARERIADFETFAKHANRIIDVMNENACETEAIDMQDLYARFTLDTAATFLFNTVFDTLGLPLPRAATARMGIKGSAIPGTFGVFATAFEECQRLTMERARRDAMWPLYEFFGSKMKKQKKVIEAWLDPIVQQTLQSVKIRESAGDVENWSFLEYMAANTDDVNMIRDELLNILLAARDTTASLLTFTTYLLSQHSEVLKRLRSEILGICPNGRIPSYEDIRNMKYLRAVLNETLRLYPPVPGNVRASKSQRPTLIPVGPASDFGHCKSVKPLYIPPDTEVSYGVFMLQRRKDLWGDNADLFDPQRWLDSEKLQNTFLKNPMIFVPFNAGPRICLGQQFALNEASFVLVRLLQHFESFELAEDAQPKESLPPAHWQRLKSRARLERLWPKSELTLYIRGGLWVRAKRAKNI